jgi:hypothetical protein
MYALLPSKTTIYENCSDGYCLLISSITLAMALVANVLLAVLLHTIRWSVWQFVVVKCIHAFHWLIFVISLLTVTADSLQFIHCAYFG